MNSPGPVQGLMNSPWSSSGTVKQSLAQFHVHETCIIHLRYPFLHLVRPVSLAESGAFTRFCSGIDKIYFTYVFFKFLNFLVRYTFKLIAAVQYEWNCVCLKCRLCLLNSILENKHWGEIWYLFISLNHIAWKAANFTCSFCTESTHFCPANLAKYSWYSLLASVFAKVL